MGKTVKFSISMRAAEFKDIESLRRKAGRTRSQFVRDAVAAWEKGPAPPPAIREGHSEYGSPLGQDIQELEDPKERRRRAIAAAGKFHSGTVDLSADHDRYLEEAFAEGRPEKGQGRNRRRP